MTPKQFFTRLRTDLQALTWEASPQGKMFGDAVYIVAKIPIEQISSFRHPTCFIVDSGAILDKDHPGLLNQNFQLSIFVENMQDYMTQGILLSANRVTGESYGAGLLDIEEELIPWLIDKTTLSTKIMLIEKGIPKPTVAKGNNPSMFRNMSFNVLLSLY